MQVMSKLNKKEDILTWTRYFDENINIHKYKIPELKKILRFHKLRVTGKKSILIERILEHFIKCKNVVKIQSLMRKHVFCRFLLFVAKQERHPGVQTGRKLTI